MDTSPSYFDPENLTTREQFRRYGKRHPNSSISPHRENSASSRPPYDGQSNIHSPTNAALLLENIKQEFESTPAKTRSVSKRRSLFDVTEVDDSAEAVRYSLKLCKHEEDSLADDGDTTFALFASLLDSALQGLMPFSELILRLEESCRNVSESIMYGSNIRHRIVEDKLMRQKAQLLLDEAASWSLLWYLFGKGTEETPKELILFPSTSLLEACQFVADDLTAQLCLRIVQWLEGLTSKALDLERKVRGSHVGACLPSSGIWFHTQRYLKKGTSSANTVHHLDFDAPTREQAHLLPDDKKHDESLLEDVWTLLRAGRLEEACNLCRSKGQAWRAATLCIFGGSDQSPSIEALVRNGKNRTLQAIELESRIGHQWYLWKWASYCASEKIAEQDAGKYEAAVYAAQCSNLRRMLPICTDWESACWAIAKSWLDFQVDLELAHLQPERLDQITSTADAIDGSPAHGDGAVQPSSGPGSWPLQVSNQQPRQLLDLIQKLHSGELVHESVTRGCKEPQRQIEMILMLGDIPRLLDLIWSWIAPSEDDQNVFRPHGDPQMIRFGAHLVLVLRYLLDDEFKDTVREKIMNIGDLIVHMYAMFLFSNQHEELVGIYASQLARHRCIDLFVHMMELRLDSSVHVKYKIFLSAIEYLQFSPLDNSNSKASFEEIVERVFSRSREIKVGQYDKISGVAEQHRLQSLQKAMVIQWLCFTPPSTISNVKDVGRKLLLRALVHSNILFREFSLVSMWRVPAVPIGAHTVLSFLAEPLKQLSESSDTLEDVSQNLKEFHDWNEYYSCDAKYRNWLKIKLENAEVSPVDLSMDEKQRAVSAAKETLNSSLSLLLRKENPWLASGEDHAYGSVEPTFLELHATAMLCLASGECLFPDATVCTTLMSALYSSVSEEDVLNRQLMLNVSISSKDNCCIEVVLRCLAVPGDGFGPQEHDDGGILGTVMAAGFKGELPRFQPGVTMDISRLDAWYSSKDGSLESPATYIVQGLCRRCCLPEVILRCMQVSLSLIELGIAPESHDQLIELVACPEAGFLHLFSDQQLQEFLLFEREYSISQMEVQEEISS
ncbi:putative nuclear pore protein 84/107 [Rosa chinensis]|uniref:Nuclear pore complex protein n=1 Tax=Rosa chinensis TaxID=74649 RepID=A0A2P6RYV9_ROSCH|nr:nuclear pore complex protein NUP107 [Rosa chinensis]PRQ51617.1 putative nuclear pore protein 84/107 [Rosa chinensis]